MTQLWREVTGVGASTERNQMTDPGPCQPEVERHLLQVLPGDSGTWPDLASPRKDWKCPRVFRREHCGVLSWWAAARS